MPTLRELRVISGFTQQEVAERLNVSVGQVSRWEQPGGPRPQPSHRQRLARLYRVSVYEIHLALDIEKPPDPNKPLPPDPTPRKKPFGR